MQMGAKPRTPDREESRRRVGAPTGRTGPTSGRHQVRSGPGMGVLLPTSPNLTEGTGRTSIPEPPGAAPVRSREAITACGKTHAVEMKFPGFCRRLVSVEIHQVFLPHAPCQPGASPASALTRVPPPAVHHSASLRSALRFRNTLGPVSSLTRLVSRAPRPHRENWPVSALTRVSPQAARGARTRD